MRELLRGLWWGTAALSAAVLAAAGLDFDDRSTDSSVGRTTEISSVNWIARVARALDASRAQRWR
ncbi:hypothetical protein [Sorangium sp. So ce362]|uniref:hypothetical protein n=1 Tax=Sorangium sp. So ce362 TaxID=3133303 RepID=UPI003F5FA1AE